MSKFLPTPSFALELDDTEGGRFYIGEAPAGSPTDSDVWRIRLLTEKITPNAGDLKITFADGDQEFDNIWDQRGSINFY